jgi:Na+-translocating ferredoxin:NAD+ oxidoreductase RnfD subunit
LYVCASSYCKWQHRVNTWYVHNCYWILLKNKAQEWKLNCGMILLLELCILLKYAWKPTNATIIHSIF